MALTKVQKTGITDNAIDADKIEDGTIVAADIAPGTITNAKLAGSIANDKLANSSITVNGTSVSLGGSVSAGKVQWQSVKTASFTAVAGEGYFIDTTSSAITATLPASPSAGDTIAIKDYAGTFGTNALTIGRNGNNIQGVANDSLISTNRASVVLVYIDATKGWLFTNESNVNFLGPTYIEATGGTISTSGDFKIHTFTGDGTFVVSSLGTQIPASNDTVDYLVVAGGGGAGQFYSGGGGAGGFRESKDSTLSSPHTASPLAATTGLTITATTYPITVGSGGTGAPGPYVSTVAGTNGSNSVFSTITSAGGGYGGGGNTPGFGCTSSYGGNPGGSGGGAGFGPGTRPGGSGNTPPTSPPQGNPGGCAPAPASYNGGGGGAGGAGGGGGSYGNEGGIGAGTGINPSCTVGTSGPDGSLRYFAGGGSACGGPACGAGTIGGGGAGGGTLNGVANTGGGGAGNAGDGGKGIVIIRYKYQ